MMNTIIAQTIRERRKELRMDQVSLARMAGVSVHALSDLETGKGNPTLATVLKVLEVLGMTLTTSLRNPGVDHA